MPILRAFCMLLKEFRADARLLFLFSSPYIFLPTYKWIRGLQMPLLSFFSTLSHLTISISSPLLSTRRLGLCWQIRGYTSHDKIYLSICLSAKKHSSPFLFFLPLIFSRDSQNVLKETLFFNWHLDFFSFQRCNFTNIKKMKWIWYYFWACRCLNLCVLCKYVY